MANPTLLQYRKLFCKVAEDQKRKAFALGLAYNANVETGEVQIMLYQRTFKFDGLTAAGTALDMMKLERQPQI
jgi:hypothetical protein